MITVFVTGCGGAVGLGVIKALRMGSGKLRLIGVDADPYAACFYVGRKKSLLDQTHVVPRAENSKYVYEIIRMCRKENVDVIFPCTDVELEKLATSKRKIVSSGTKIIVSPPETIKICRDKWLTYYRLNKQLPMVKSALPDMGIEEALRFTGLPAVVKPRLGWGSRQTYKVQSLDEAKNVISNIDKPLIQTWIEGEEYTVDGLANRHGQAICVVPRRRIKVLSGLSFQGVTVKDKELIELGKKITEYLRIIGPFNFQARKINGKSKIFEINARFAGTGILSVKAGANIPLLAVKDICNIKIPAHIDFKEGVAVARFFEEAFFRVDEAQFHDN